jgi:hypothetical protein
MALSLGATCFTRQGVQTDASSGQPTLLGEIISANDFDTGVKIDVHRYDSDGNLIDIRGAFTCVDPMPAGSVSPFSVYVGSHPDWWYAPETPYPDWWNMPATPEPQPPMSYYRIEVIEYPNPGTLVAAWGLTASSTSHYDDDGRLHVEGFVRNDSDRTWLSNWVCVAFHDAEGNIVFVDSTHIYDDEGNPAPVPGQSAPFWTWSPYGQPVAGYAVYPAGRSLR